LFARDWPRGAGFCLAVIACLSQLSAPAHHQLAQSVAASFSDYSALDTRSGFAPAPFDTVHASVPCAAHRSGPPAAMALRPATAIAPSALAAQRCMRQLGSSRRRCRG